MLTPFNIIRLLILLLSIAIVSLTRQQADADQRREKPGADEFLLVGAL